MMNDINRIIGYYIHKSIVLPNNKYALQLKKDLLGEEANLLIVFDECLTIDDIRVNDILIEDISNQKNIGMSYIFMARNTNRKPEEYNQLIIFDKKNEKIISNTTLHNFFGLLRIFQLITYRHATTCFYQFG